LIYIYNLEIPDITEAVKNIDAKLLKGSKGGPKDKKKS